MMRRHIEEAADRLDGRDATDGNGMHDPQNVAVHACVGGLEREGVANERVARGGHHQTHRTCTSVRQMVRKGG